MELLGLQSPTTAQKILKCAPLLRFETRAGVTVIYFSTTQSWESILGGTEAFSTKSILGHFFYLRLSNSPRWASLRMQNSWHTCYWTINWPCVPLSTRCSDFRLCA